MPTDGTVYIAEYHTESSDRGVVGYWRKKPTEQQLRAYFKKHFPDEFEDGHVYVYWTVRQLKEIQ